ncbi:MAG: hypothetical protein NUV61_02305 [Candidatus Azambacteria bacterium]|nr:hypothetical protein [Candidatus Azambacteria bacterium]
MATEGHHFEETPRDHILHEEFDAIRSDPHFEGVLWDELDAKDIGLLDKFLRGTLKEDDVNKRLEELAEEGRDREDPNSNFLAGLLNKLVSQKTFEKYKKVGNA